LSRRASLAAASAQHGQNLCGKCFSGFVPVTGRAAKTREIRLSIGKSRPKPADKLKHVLHKKPNPRGGLKPASRIWLFPSVQSAARWGRQSCLQAAFPGRRHGTGHSQTGHAFLRLRVSKASCCKAREIRLDSRGRAEPRLQPGLAAPRPRSGVSQSVIAKYSTS
jgi:hypothetical protein